ncbi:hypothetical protein VNO77_05030 [Canavalia gladiata]|uniref:Uncharacterized protein n=1 Tax=Canavalia gladiata TaxID=3824 RepID=A0AAN9MXL2_CANGL
MSGSENSGRVKNAHSKKRNIFWRIRTTLKKAFINGGKKKLEYREPIHSLCHKTPSLTLEQEANSLTQRRNTTLRCTTHIFSIDSAFFPLSTWPKTLIQHPPHASLVFTSPTTSILTSNLHRYYIVPLFCSRVRAPNSIAFTCMPYATLVPSIYVISTAPLDQCFPLSFLFIIYTHNPFFQQQLEENK